MTHEDAMRRLAGCRASQPEAMQVLVGCEIVDALLRPMWGPGAVTAAARQRDSQEEDGKT